MARGLHFPMLMAARRPHSIFGFSLRRRLPQLVLVPVALGALSACAPTFHAQDSEGNDMITAESVGQPSAMLKTVDGSVSWTANSELELEFETKIPFGRIFKMSSDVVKGLLPYSCQFITGLTNSPITTYKKGEIPCGGVIDQSWKQLLVVTVEGRSGHSSGFDYSVSGAKIPVWISRIQRSGSYSESNLDTKTLLTRPSSRNFGEDISLRYVPAGANARLELCMNIPGTTLTSSDQRIHASAWKRVLGVKLSYGSDFEMSPGQAQFDYARGCFAMDFGWTGTSTAPQIQLKTTELPALANARYEGLNIRIEDWFLRLVDNTMNFFKASIRKKVQARLVNKVNTLLDQDVESGRWFTKIHGEDLVKNTGTKLTQQISKAVNRIGLPSSIQDLRTQIKDSCRLKKLSLSKDWTQRLEEFCQNVVSKTEIHIEPFARDEKSQALGCYAHLARLHDSNGKWWAKDCQFASRFSVKIPLQYKDYLEELKLIIASHISVDRIPESWKDALADLNLDEATLALVLEELERRGYNQVTAGDFGQRVQEILALVRSRITKTI